MTPSPVAVDAAPRRLSDGLARNVVVLGAVSFFTDLGSEMIAPVRILFLVLVLGTPIPLAGLIEGVAESTASLFKIVSGRLADRMAKRTPLILIGYGVSNAVKPLLALATGWPQVLGIVFLDRLGKGLRGSPRDALMADVTPVAYRGEAFGFHRAMDTFGAALGPVLTLFILTRSAQDVRHPAGFLQQFFTYGSLSQLLGDLHDVEDSLRRVFAWTALPGLVSVLVLLLFLREGRRPRPLHPPATTVAGNRRSWALGPRFWLFSIAATVFSLGNSSDAFFFLRAVTLDAWLEALPLMYFGYNVVYAILATPLGVLSDRWGRLPVLLAGYVAFGVVYAGWAVANTGWQTWVLFLVYGVYAAATEGVAKAFVIDLAPKARRGAAIGWFNGLTGFAALPSNVLAGLVWTRYGPGSTFALGAILAAVAASLLLAWSPRLVGSVPAVPEIAGG